jgi:RHS repeat-associated protein
VILAVCKRGWGATTTFGYNNRHLATSISYGVPAGVADTPNVSLGYDAAGNRTSMTDGLGSVSYGYDQLSRLTSETRMFTGVGSFALNYAYNLAGQLTSTTNPWGAQVGYGYDKVGELTGVTGSGYAGVSNYASGITYRAFGAIKGMSYGNGRALSVNYDNRLRMTRWDVAGVLGSDYEYRWEDTFRPTFAHSRTDATLDRWYAYDHVGRLSVSRSGSEARAAYGEPFNGLYDGPYSMGVSYDVWGNITAKEGWGGENPAYTASYTNNRRDGFGYDAAGNLTNDGGQSFTYDATGQQATASLISGQQYYDGDMLRLKKTENGATRYYLRSTVLGGQVVAEMDASGTWMRGYVYQGSTLLAVQAGGVNWVHEDPVTKSKRVTDNLGNVVSAIELDPWGGDTNRSSNAAFQPKKFTSYERDVNGSDEAMFRRYNRWHSRFDQPDPWDGSYDLTDPQSFNRYAYVQNDPVNFVDPSGLLCWGNFEFVNGRWIFLGVTRCTPDRDDVVPVEPRGGGGSETPGDVGAGGGGPQNPPTKKPTQSTAAKVSACCGRCFNQGRLDNVIKDVGKAAGHPGIGEFVASLTVIGSVAAIGNEALNLTSLGSKARSGLGGPGYSRAGDPTTWQHTVSGASARSNRIPMIGRVGKIVGRVAEPLSLSMLALEGGYWQGQMAACIAACTLNPSSY